MSVLISGALVDGAGIPLSGCHIILKSRVNTSEVVMRTIADVVTGNNGEYSFEAQAGKYCVYLKQDWRDEYCVGDISVYHDAKPGTLNDFLTALSEDDLKPDVVRRFEEMVAQAQQSAEAAAESERLAGQHAADAQKIKENCQTLADNVQQNAEAVADNVQKAEKLASETAQNAARAEQAAKDADKAVDRAVDKLGEAATLTGEAKASAEAAARSEQNAKGHADNAAGSAQQTAQDVTAATTARQDAERFANEAKKSAQASGTARDESVGAAESARRYHNAASSAATSAELSANTARGHANTATEQARRAKESQDASAGNAQEAKQYRDEAQQIVDGLNATNASTTEKGLVQLCSATDSDSEALAATPKAVKTVMDEVKEKAPLNSPALAGTPTTPTPDLSATGREIANAAFVRALIASLVDAVPETLNTLKELADALGNDPNFATTMTNALAGKQPLSDVLTSLSSLPATGNKMPYFSDKNVMALANLTAVGRELTGQNSKGEVLDYLGLKGAATKDVQTGIRDRTPGRVAIPGAFGYGHMFKSSDALTFRGPSDFAEWLKEVTPERYAVSIADSSALLAGTSKFNGIIEVMWSPFDNDESDTTRKFKTLMCYNQYYEGEHSIHRLTYRWSGDNWNATASPVIYDGDSLAFLLSRTAGSDVYFKYPAVGVPVLAVYRGTTSGDKEIKIGLGDVVSGSQLGGINIMCAISSAGSGSYGSTPQVGATGYTFPGRYMALSGVRDSYGTSGRICLFVRIE
ncbi:phage tail protein [Salmonella enterica subsp. enterica serovar Newport]|nr:phage tail protein [Salmonella enterica subsp. enterica serovar Newport]EBS2389609.1 phage tail protein [Salmonella enterica subsp. enterica serovar Newport]ECA8780708.1 phage tail protein [Salmonella enterica subsp. enterica serovar Newport]ECD2004728.1 phage tail protein [Salmonella enterica subsp. enterica serovar Newport]